MVAWDVAEVESAEIAADLVQRACLKERYQRPSGFGSHQCHQPLILHADNGNAMRGATLESRLEEMGVLRSFSRPRVSNDNHLVGITVPNAQVPARLPEPAIREQRRGLRVGGGVCGLVKPPTPPQRHQVRHAPSASQRSRHGNLPAAN